MKKILLLLFVFSSLISCTNDDEISSENTNPNLLQKVIFNPNTTYEKHWNFYSNGLLKEITTANGTLLQSFAYDSNNNLINNTIYGAEISSHIFTYDASNKITSYNGNNVTYIPTENAYKIQYNYTITNPNSYDVLDNHKILLNNEGLIVQEYQNYLIMENGNLFTESLPGYTATRINGNLTGFYDAVASSGSYEFDTKINPFKLALMPICKAMGITNFRGSNTKWAIGEYNSQNNIIRNDYDIDGPEFQTYFYNYNLNNLPINQSNVEILYYYQGDLIP